MDSACRWLTVLVLALPSVAVCRAAGTGASVELTGALPSTSSALSEAGAREVIQFDSELVPGLAQVALDGVVRVASWPIEARTRRSVLLTRYDIYAPDARIVEIRSGGREVEVPRSKLRFFELAEDGGPARGFVSVDVEAGTVYAMAQTALGMTELRYDAESRTHTL